MQFLDCEAKRLRVEATAVEYGEETQFSGWSVDLSVRSKIELGARGRAFAASEKIHLERFDDSSC